MRNKKAFTLIELIAVLVILAILALIVTPIVMNIINKAKTSANKRSIDAYGRSIELAIASHMLDTGEIPESIDELTIEYSGDEVVCETQELNSGSTVYLAGCTVGGKTVEGYTYGKSSSSDSETTTYKAYNVGDLVEYNHNTYYVIKNSDETESSVTLLKDVPLMEADVNTYLTSTGVGGTATSINGYGGMAYGSSSDYATSIIKKVVDAWAQDTTNSSDLVEDSTGYSARLITCDEFENLGFVEGNITPSDIGWVPSENTPNWVYNSQYQYWTMDSKGDSSVDVWIVSNGGTLSSSDVRNCAVGVRPVITIKKSAVE